MGRAQPIEVVPLGSRSEQEFVGFGKRKSAGTMLRGKPLNLVTKDALTHARHGYAGRAETQMTLSDSELRGMFRPRRWGECAICKRRHGPTVRFKEALRQHGINDGVRAAPECMRKLEKGLMRKH
jgi:hypothetical protein